MPQNPNELRDSFAAHALTGILTQYQGGMCISGRLTMTERTPRRRILPLGPNWAGTDSAVERYVHFTLALG